jgi:hypothetical protein
VRLIEQWISRPFKAVFVFDGVDFGRLGLMAMSAALTALFLLIGLGVRALIRGRHWLLLTVCAWGGLQASMYLVILPSSGHAGRYQPFLLLLLLPLLVLGLATLLAKSRLLSVAAPAVVLLVVGSVSLALWKNVLASGIDHINHTHGVIAGWLERNLPGQRVAVFDIGRIGYDRGTSGDPNIVDLGGLTDPAYIGYLKDGRVPSYLAGHGIRYLVLPVDPAGHSTIFHALRLSDPSTVVSREIFRVCSASSDWQIGYSQTRSAFQCQEVDSVTFPRISADARTWTSSR